MLRRASLCSIVLVAALSCGPSYEVLSVRIELDPPAVPLPALAADGSPVRLQDIRAARGELLIDVAARKVVFTAAGLYTLPPELVSQGFRFRLWGRDRKLTPTYLGELAVDGVGRGTFRALYTSNPPPLASIREAIVVLWYDESPVQVDPTSTSGSGLSGDLGQRKDAHGSAGRPGWVLDGDAEDLPATTGGDVHGGH